jgi:hypothetical protein
MLDLHIVYHLYMHCITLTPHFLNATNIKRSHPDPVASFFPITETKYFPKICQKKQKHSVSEKIPSF